ncbi:MAG: sel1 repeat family protein [Rhodobacteraceae bacterium]|nr:sel1 repeat family protein [Paracoccaceae bacterium]
MRILAFLTLTLAPVAAFAEAESGGTLNPEEMTIGRILEDAENGVTSMTNCAAGYYITKAGRHVAARRLFSKCAESGYTGAMTWMSQLDDNGLGAPENPDAAAIWDQRAAEAGDPVGAYNYGLDLMRGRGTVQDVEAGRRLVDQAALAGLPTARRLQAAGYDLDEVTPDADNWKYAPLF